MSTVAEQRAVQAPTAHGRYRGWLLALLSVCTFISFVDRYSITVMLPQLKAEFALHDWQLGVISGVTFGLFYAVAGIPIGWLADRLHRPTLMAVAMGLWSLMTAAGGMARSFLSLAIFRIFVGVGEAGFTPAATSLVIESVATPARSLAMGIVIAGGGAGAALGLMVTGYLIELYGWRGAMVAIAVPGPVAALLLITTLREPRATFYRTRFQGARLPNVRQSLGKLARNRTYLQILAAIALSGIAIQGIAQWIPTFLAREFGLPPHQVGLFAGLSQGLGALTGFVAGGWASSALAKGRQGQSSPLILAAAAMLASIPFFCITIATHSIPTTVAAIFIATVASHMASAPMIASINLVVSSSYRSLAVGIYGFATTAIGFALGPVIVGTISDLAAGYGLKAGFALAASIMVLPALSLVLAARSVGRDVHDQAVSEAG